jgi:uncharacterized protein (DUF58 family)
MRAFRAVLTTRGLAFFLSGILLMLAGIVLGFPDLTRVSVLLMGLPIISATLVRTRRTRMRIERHSHPERVSVGQDAAVTLSFENVSSSTTPIFLAEERLDHVLGDRPRFVVGRIPPGRVRAIDYQVRSSLRGRHRLGPLGVQVQDPFGLANRNAVLEGTTDLVVLPAVHPLSSSRHPSAGVGSEGEQAHLIALHGEDDVTIREYREGDDLRHIHWPATARTGDLMVRQEDRPAQRRALVVLDPRPAAHGGTGVSSSFEWAVTAAASVAVHLLASGYAVHVVCAETVESSRAADTLTSDEILDVLAVTRLRDDKGDDEILRAAQALASSGGLVVALVGPHEQDVTLRLASLRQPGTTGIAFVLDSRTFGDSAAEPVDAHVDALRLAGWRAVAVRRDDEVAHSWAVLNAAAVGGSR